MAKDTYRVVGGQPLLIGGERRFKGDEFTADLDERDATFLIQIGALERATNAPQRKAKREE